MEEHHSIQFTPYTYTNGDVIIREYNQTACNLRYNIKHKERLNKSEDCVCGGRFSEKGRCNHYRTKKHKRYMEYNEIQLIISDI